MANWLTRQLDRFTPFNMPGETTRRKKREFEQQQQQQTRSSRGSSRPSLSVGVAQPTQDDLTVEQPKLTVQRPENLFADLNNSLKLPGASPAVPVVRNEDMEPTPVLQPGTVVAPPIKVTTAPARTLRTPNGVVVNRDPNAGVNPNELVRPRQSVGNRFRDVFDTNTEADQYRRQEGNKRAIAAGKPEEVKDLRLERQGNVIGRTPIVGTVAKMLNTAGVQIAQAPAVIGGQFASNEYAAATRELLEAQRSGDRNRIAAAKSRIDGAIRRLDDYTNQQDAASSMFQKNDGGLFNTGTLYGEEGARKGDIGTGLKDVVLPTAVAGLDLYTLGQGTAITTGLKEGGKGALRKVAPNIAKASAGNYASGDLDARSQGATGLDPVKAGLINTILGLAPDIGLPMLGRSLRDRVIPKIMRGKNVNPADVVEELDDAAISASAEAANQALKPKPIPVREEVNIPIRTPDDPGANVPVRVSPQPIGQPIKEVAGDFGVTSAEKLQQVRVDAQRAQADDFNAATSAPDRSIEGITPRTFEDMTGATRKSIEEERIALDEAFANKEINKTQLKAANKELDDMVTQAEGQVGQGRKIEVKEAQTIDVANQTVAPQGLPETPGKVRVTTQSDPNAVRTEAAASAPVVSRPAALPADVQEVLDNPKRFTKREVASARNQRKLARAKAKATEDTAAAVERIDTATPTKQSEDFAPTGDFKRGRKGNAYEGANNIAERKLGEQEMSTRSVEDLALEIGQKNTLDPGDARRISAAKQNLLKADPENARSGELYQLLDRAEKAGRTRAAQIMALIPRTVRRTASSDTLTGRWDNKVGRVLDDPTKITDADLKTVQKANDDFTLARDNASRLEEQWKKTGSDADFKAWEKAFNEARKADTEAKMIELQVAQRVLKGQKGANVTKTIDDLKKEANVNSMDIVSANMLSGTATGFRNTLGTEIAGVENRLFANTRAKITNKLFGENVGGYDRKGARLGRKVGIVKQFGDAGRRAEVGGKNPLEMAKNWATTINSGGESSLQSQVYSRLGKYYKNQADGESLTKQQLDQRMRHTMLTDPDGMLEVFTDSVMKSSGLTGLFEKGQTIEKAVTDYIGRQTDSRTLQAGSKLLMRLAVGFPTATTNFLYQSGKRLTLGLPSFIETGAKIAKGDKAAAAQAFDRGLKEFGSGGAILGLGAALGSADMISGAYPSDPEERERWTREGISENSINIGGNWYPIPQGAGMLGLPLLTGAAIGRNGADGLKEMYSRKNLAKLLPTDQMQGFLNMASGNGAPQDLKNFVASGVRASTPVGALLNQISKSFDETKNDTTTKDFWSNVIDQIGTGIPGVNNAMNIPTELDADGNEIKNPGAIPLAFGAASSTQGGGEERTAELRSEVATQLKGLEDLGIIGNTDLDGVLEGDAAEAYKKMSQGRELSGDDVKKIKEGFVKGVSSEGTDTAYLEREQYDTNLAVLKLKRDLMDDDKTVKPSSLKDIDTAIKRGEIYKQDQMPYELIKSYQSTGVEEWRKMGDPEADEYDPDMYQKLFEIDDRLTKAGVSYKKGALDKAKFFLKESKAKGTGRGGSGGSLSASETSADFGRLKAGDFAPSVRQYESIDQRTGSVPIIKTVRPNIVHKIGSSG